MDFFLPIIVLLAVGVIAMWWSGGGYQPGVDITTAFQETDVTLRLLYAAFAFMAVGMIGSHGYGTMDLDETSDTIINGFKTMIIAAAIIVLAWTMGLAAEEVGTAEYIVNAMVSGGVPAEIGAFSSDLCNRRRATRCRR